MDTGSSYKGRIPLAGHVILNFELLQHAACHGHWKCDWSMCTLDTEICTLCNEYSLYFLYFRWGFASSDNYIHSVLSLSSMVLSAAFTYEHTYTHTHTHIIYTCTQTDTHTHTHTYIHAHTHTHTHTYTYMHTNFFSSSHPSSLILIRRPSISWLASKGNE